MSLLLKQILNLNVFKDAKLITTIPDQENIIVESISAMEYPIGDFVKTNEIVLSTGIFCQDESIFIEFVGDIIRMKGAALILATGHYINDVPKSIVSLAEKNKLAIITIPWEIKFSDIVKQTYNLLDNENDPYFDKFIQIKDRLLLLYLDKSSSTSAINYISQKINFELQLIDVNNNVLAETMNYNIYKNCKEQFKFKISHDTTIYAYLNILDNNNFIKNNKKYYIESINLNIVNPLILRFERKKTLYELEMHNKEKFILDLIDNKFTNFEKAIDEGKSLGFDLEKNYIAIVSKVEFLAKSKTYDNSINLIKKSSIRLAKDMSRQCLVAYRNTFLVILLEQSYETIDDTMSYINKLEKIILNDIPNITFYWGIGDIYKNSNSIYFSYKDALLNLKHSLVYKSSHISTMNTTREFKIFSELAKNKKVMALTKDILSDLLNEENKELLDSIESYYKNERNISKTAKDLFLHRQSLNYRLKKIEKITNLRLDNPNDNFLLEFSLRLYSFNKFMEN